MNTRRFAATVTTIAVAASLISSASLAQAATTASSPPPAASATKTLNSCNPKVAVLPAVVEGNPKVTPGASEPTQDGTRTGLYVWHDTKGWRVRLTHNEVRSDPAVPQVIEVRGQVAASRPITHLRLVRLEPAQRGEWVSVRKPGRRVLDFRFVNGGYVDGINFAAGCAGKLTITVWKVVRDPQSGKVLRREPIPVFVGAGRSAVRDAVPANPGLVVPPSDATRVKVPRTTPAAA